MTGSGIPVAIRWGLRDPTAPQIVLLHNHDATQNRPEQDITAFVRYLPDGVGYASVRGLPAAQFGLYRLLGWLDEQLAPQVPVVLVGFGSGATFAGGLMLTDPTRPDPTRPDALRRGRAVVRRAAV